MTSDHPGDDREQQADEPQPRSAEQWLAERGISREPIKVPAPEQGADRDAGDAQGPPPSAREAAQLANEAPPRVPGRGVDPDAPGGADPGGPDAERPGSSRGNLGDEVSRAIAFIQRSTARTPASSGRLRRKLADRDVPTPAIRLAIEQAVDQGLVDDETLAAALADEGREKGHAPKRIRADLRKREFDEDVITAALDRFDDRDPEAVAFDAARRKVNSLRGLDTEKAFRRLFGYLSRRGHNQHVARKIARQVIFDDREHERIAGH